MHALAAHLPVIVAAEKSRTAFYIVGSLLVVWAIVVSVLLGLRMSDFPRSPGAQRVVMLISAGLVIATGATGVITAGTPTKSAAAATAHQTTSAPAPAARP